MTDEVEIRALSHAYADAASRRDPAGLTAVFSDEGEWDGEGLGLHQGRGAIEAFFGSMLDGWSIFLQGLLSGVVTLDSGDPDRAQGRWFVQEVGQREDGTRIDVAGVYHDSYERHPAVGWRIRRRRYDPLLVRVGDDVAVLPFPDQPS